jgi:hypothetical protein
MAEPTRRGIAGALVLALGIAACGWFVGSGLTRFRTADRLVTVKGISEREVRADIAIWPLHIVGSDDDLTRAHAQLEASTREIRNFLERHGIDPAQSHVQSFSVTDALANPYGSPQEAANRYVIRQTLIVRSSEPDKILAASASVGELVSAGVVLTSGSEYQAGGPTFLFTGLNKLKPDMIAEATSRAREAAEQFAKDSGARIGGIHRANQGLFEILPRDRTEGITEENQLEKIVRVVATIEYQLRD